MLHGTPVFRNKDNINVDSKENGCYGVDSINVAQIRA
jgi:hypothetical protein